VANHGAGIPKIKAGKGEAFPFISALEVAFLFFF
jgi:hypothetical protein